MRRVAGTFVLLSCLLVAGYPAPSSEASASATCRRLTESDEDAQALIASAQTTASTYFTDHDGLYMGLSLRALREEEPNLPINRKQAAHEQEGAYLSRALAIEHGEGYVLKARTLDGDTYALRSTSDGEVVRIGSQRETRCNW